MRIRQKSIKQEPRNDEESKVENEDINHCVLFSKGLRLQNIFAKHIQLEHSNEGQDELKPPSAICSCVDGLKMKIDIISYVMLHFPPGEAHSDTSNALCLCPSGLFFKQGFSDHIQELHADELKLFNELKLPLKYCLCDEGLKLQSNLINHLMSHFYSTSTAVEIKVEPKLRDYDEAASVESCPDDADSDQSENLPLATTEPQKCFVCDTCSFSTPDRNFLQLHWKAEHDPSNEFCCKRKYCRSRFKTQSELVLHGRVHERSDASTKSSLCHICSKFFSSAGQLKAHLKTHQEKSFCCDLCGSKFKTRQEVKVHVLRHKGLWQYSKVQRLFPTKVRVKKERIKKIPDELKPFKCEYEGCPRRFKLQSQLQDHINVHLGVKPYKCDHCPESFRARNGLTTHQKLHTDPYKNFCHICQRSFSTKNALQDHNDSLHSGQLPYACSYCQNTFRLKKQLLAHIETHERVHCDICRKSVLVQKFEKHKLKHQATLNGDKPFKCDYEGCDASFLYSSHLSDHKNVHSNLRPHRCDICSEGFNYRSAMLRHRQTHVDPDKFRCEICQKSYASAYSLSLHDRLHASDQNHRPFACSFKGCDMTFKFKDHVQKHYRKMHERAGRVKCKFCSKTFFSNYHLIRHKSTVHKIDPATDMSGTSAGIVKLADKEVFS